MTSEMTREFAITVRGYDRTQVDDYIDTLGQWLNNSTIRMEAAEAETAELRHHVLMLRTRLAQVDQQANDNPPRTLVALGERVTHILQQADEGAAAVLADAEAEALSMVARAGEHADEIMRAAQAQQAEVAGLVASAQHEAALTVQQAEARAAEAVARLTAESEVRAAKREAEADQRARDMVAEAQAEATRVLDLASAQRAKLEADLQRLSAERTEVLAGLAKLRESLQLTIGAVPDEYVADQTDSTPRPPPDSVSPPGPGSPPLPAPAEPVRASVAGVLDGDGADRSGAAPSRSADQ